MRLEIEQPRYLRTLPDWNSWFQICSRGRGPNENGSVSAHPLGQWANRGVFDSARLFSGLLEYEVSESRLSATFYVATLMST
jgi:hypothetical protein